MITTLKYFFAFLFISIIYLSQTYPAIAQFQPGVIMSDSEFVDYNSMSMDDIQRFLKDKKSYLADYVDPAIRVRASQLIYDNSQLARINPKVLITTLQKEQSLITEPLTQRRLDWATGFGVCDSCSKSDPKLQRYKGFANQIDYAASTFRLFYDNPQSYGFKVGSTYTIDDERVTIGNRATHALYLYTPHIPGNKNFYKIWKNWFTHEFPDGTLLQDSETGGIFIIQNGQKRPFASMLAFASRYDLEKVIVTSPENLSSFPLGPPIKYAQYSLLQDSKTGGIYLIVDDKKRPIVSREAFRKIGFNPEEVEQVSPEDLATIPTGEPITEENAHPTGALLQDTSTGGVWYVRDNVRHAIWSREIMNANFPYMKISPAKTEEIEKFRQGEPVKFKDGELVSAVGDPAVYVISNGLKLPIPTEKVFEKLGYDWKNVIQTSQKALSLHRTGEPLNIQNL